jgi:hypothetical protein
MVVSAAVVIVGVWQNLESVKKRWRLKKFRSNVSGWGRKHGQSRHALDLKNLKKYAERPENNNRQSQQ